MTAGIPVLDNTPEIRPASDEDVAKWRRRLLARIEADRARIAELETEIRGLTESRANWRKQAEWNDATIAKQEEEIERLKAQLANCQASSEEIRATAKERTR